MYLYPVPMSASLTPVSLFFTLTMSISGSAWSTCKQFATPPKSKNTSVRRATSQMRETSPAYTISTLSTQRKGLLRPCSFVGCDTPGPHCAAMDCTLAKRMGSTSVACAKIWSSDLTLSCSSCVKGYPSNGLHTRVRLPMTRVTIPSACATLPLIDESPLTSPVPDPVEEDSGSACVDMGRSRLIEGICSNFRFACAIPFCVTLLTAIGALSIW
mmetsp:Transcript_67167/g.165775  ORF Transcript_67167/g.165775 Transcript_67167/m.165775 type:complete len:214 (-) Transcript_67167:194-835(-)